MNAAPSTRPSIDALFSDISQYIADCRALLDSGNVVELSGLDDKIRILCEQTMELTPQDKDVYAERLGVLAVELEALSSALHEQKQMVEREIDQVAGSRKASIAYKVADAVDNFGKKKDKDE